MSVRLFELNAFTTASEWADGTTLSLNGEGVVQKGDAYGGMDTATLKAFATVVLQKAGNSVATFPQGVKSINGEAGDLKFEGLAPDRQAADKFANPKKGYKQCPST